MGDFDQMTDDERNRALLAEQRKAQAAQAESAEARFDSVSMPFDLPPVQFTTLPNQGLPRELRAAPSATAMTGGGVNVVAPTVTDYERRFAKPAAPQMGTEGVGGPTEPGEEDEFASAQGELERRRKEGAKAYSAAMAGGGGGGYTPEQLKLNERLRTAYETGLSGVEDVERETTAFQQDPRRATLMQQEVERQQKAVTAEEGRSKRLEDIGRQQKLATGDIAKKIDEFKIDPNRVFGQGGQRAAATFALGLANVFSNVGEAMQGKAGSNAVLGLIRDRVAQDISLQESDYRRMLQGYEVRRNGLMDAIQMVGNERQGAEALARQQVLAYAGQLGQIEQKLTDAKARAVISQAKSTILAQYGKDEQAIETANVASRNQARAQAASFAAQERRLAAQQAQALASSGISDKEQGQVNEALKTARDKGLYVRTRGLQDLRKIVEAYPNAAAEARGAIGQFWRSVAEDKDRGTVASMLSNIALEGLSDGARKYITAYSNYIGPRIRSQAGANVTAGERTLYDPEKYTTPAAVDVMMKNENRRVADEAHEIEIGAGLGVNSDARLFLRSQLYSMYGSQPKDAPALQAVTREGKPVK